MSKKKEKHQVSQLYALISLALISYNVEAIEFNSEVLDTEDNGSIDLSAFSETGYVYPGDYQFMVAVNKSNISQDTFDVRILKSTTNANKTSVCLTKNIVNKIGLNTGAIKKIIYDDENKCSNLDQFSGVEVKPSLADGTINIRIPTAWLDYSDATWVPPSRWDDGIPGVVADYNVSTTVTDNSSKKNSDYTSFNGTIGGNVGPWRLRGDYQGYTRNNFSDTDNKRHEFNWNRVYLFRAIRSLRSNLSLGENYISSDVFDSWRYLGMSLQSDDRMLPPKLRGFSQQISGVAETNALVKISQLGRVLYESTVPAGNFTIQDLDSFVRGKLDVEVVEQDGKIRTFSVDVANVPFLTRPGQVRYKSSIGRPIESRHNIEGPSFAHSELSWGINNHWSMYGGAVVSDKYNAISVGFGRDLFHYGAISADITQSVASLPQSKNKQGKSLRFNYSKEFLDIDANLSLAGYRFSDENFLSMNQFLALRYNDEKVDREKELYTITFNKFFEEINSSMSLQYSYQTYWNSNNRNYYTFSANKMLDFLDFKNISLGLTASRTEYHGRHDDSFYFRVSLPWGNGHLSYSNSLSDSKRLSQHIGYSRYVPDNNTSYNLNAGVNTGGGERNQGQFSAYYSRPLKFANVSTNFYTVEGNYTSIGASASGGLTITPEGAGFHSGGDNGSTRLLVDTNGIENVSFDGGKVITNRWGKGVQTNVSSYYRNTTYVDIKKLPDDVEAKRPTSEFVLTEGAIGYRKFDILKGLKVHAYIRMSDHSYPPFGSSVQNHKGNELGIVSDQGLTWLTGVSPEEHLIVRWGNNSCKVQVPKQNLNQDELILPCK